MFHKCPQLRDTTWKQTTGFQTPNGKSEFQEISIYTHPHSWAALHLNSHTKDFMCPRIVFLRDYMSDRLAGLSISNSPLSL